MLGYTNCGAALFDPPSIENNHTKRPINAKSNKNRSYYDVNFRFHQQFYSEVNFNFFTDSFYLFSSFFYCFIFLPSFTIFISVFFCVYTGIAFFPRFAYINRTEFVNCSSNLYNKKYTMGHYLFLYLKQSNK